MASLLSWAKKAVAQVNPFDGGATFSHPAAPRRPQPQRPLLTNNSPLNLGRPVNNPMVNRPTAAYQTPGFVTNVVHPVTQVIPKLAVSAADLLPGKQQLQPRPGIQQALLGKAPITSYQQRYGGTKAALSKSSNPIVRKAAPELAALGQLLNLAADVSIVAPVARGLSSGAKVAIKAPALKPLNEIGAIGNIGKDERILYHRTSKANAEQIAKTGKLISKENTGDIYLSNKKAGQNIGYGDTVVPVKVKKSDIQLNDEFPSGEKHYNIHSSKATPVPTRNKLGLKRLDQQGGIRLPNLGGQNLHYSSSNGSTTVSGKASQVRQQLIKLNEGGYAKIPGGKGKPSSPEQIGKALGMTDEQIKTAQGLGKTNKLPSSSARIEQQLSGLEGKGLSTSPKEASLPSIVPPKPLGANTYPLEKKVNIYDIYGRTPEKVLNKIGLKNEAQSLIKAEHQYKQVLPQELDKVTQWSKTVRNDPQASQRIFKKLDGQKVTLTPTEEQVAGEVKDYLKSWADRLKLPTEKRISNYITHIFDRELVAKEFDPDLEKLIADKVPGSVYDPFTQQRLGKAGYKEDVFQALDAYVKRATRKESFDPALDKLSSAAEALDKSGYDYVKRYGDRINMRPTDIDNLLDTAIKQSPVGYKLGQRPVSAISRGVRQATYRATLGLNFGSAVRNLTQGINTFAELGTRWTGLGYTQALKAIATKSDELQKAGVLDNSFIEDRTISALKQNVQKLDRGLWVFFQGAEKVNRGAAYYGAKAKALSEGKPLEQAVKDGVAAARKTQFTFGRVDTPVGLQSDIVKMLTQFQSYNVKQIEFVSEMVKNKEFIKLLRLTGASAVVFATVGKALGYKPSDMLPSPQIGQAPVFKIPGAIKDAADRKTGKAAMKLGSAIGSATVPAFVQGKKTVTGLNAANRGEVRKGNQTIVVPKTTGNKVKGAVFGPYSLNGVPKKEAKQKMEPGGSKKGGGYTKKEARAMNPDDLARWNSMTARARKNVQLANPDKYIRDTQLKVKEDLAKGQTTQAFKDQRDVFKTQVYKGFDRNLIGAYNLKQVDFNAFVDQASPDTIDKLRSLDKQLLDRKLIAKSKFPKSKSAGGRVASGRRRGSGSKARAFSMPKIKVTKAPKITGVKVKKTAYKKAKTRKLAVSKLPKIG